MKRHIRLAIISSGLALIAIILFSNFALGVDVLTGSPGDTITYHGQGTPGATVSLEVAASNSVSVSGDSYSDSLNGINIPAGENRLSLTVSPVETMNVTGKPSWRTGDGVNQAGSVSGNTGTYTFNNAPSGSYDVGVSGIPASGASSVSITVTVSQPVSVGSDGSYNASIDTSGLPAGTYSVKQDGQEVAKVYLGVTPPVTATPVPQSSNQQSTPIPTAQLTATPVPTPVATTGTDAGVVIPTAAAAAETPGSPTMTQSQGIDMGQAAVILGIIIILAAAGVIYLRRNKK